MANSSTPFGFRPFGHRDGSAPTMGLERMIISSGSTSNFLNGDLVGYSSAITPPSIYLTPGASVSPLPSGVFISCQYYSAALGRPIYDNKITNGSATGDITAFVCTDPEMQFLVRCSTSVTSTMIGVNFSVSSGAGGNTTTGISGESLDLASMTGASTGQFRMVDLYSNFAPPGTDGVSTAAFGIAVVVPNAWARKVLTGISQ